MHGVLMGRHVGEARGQQRHQLQLHALRVYMQCTCHTHEDAHVHACMAHQLQLHALRGGRELGELRPEIGSLHVLPDRVARRRGDAEAGAAREHAHAERHLQGTVGRR